MPVAPAPLIWINGFPGTGKFTIAKHLVRLLGGEETAILIDNHQLIDPVEIEMARTHPEYAHQPRLHPDYQRRRREKREEVFEKYVLEEEMLGTVVIFTDFQSQNHLGQSVASEYLHAARRAKRPFLPVNLSCGVEENIHRMRSTERQNTSSSGGGGGRGGKLLDVDFLEAIRGRSKLLSLPLSLSLCCRDGEDGQDGKDGGSAGLEIDVTDLEAWEAAVELRDHVVREGEKVMGRSEEKRREREKKGGGTEVGL